MFGPDRRDDNSSHNDNDPIGNWILFLSKIVLAFIVVLFILTPGILISLLLTLIFPFTSDDSFFWILAFLISLAILGLFYHRYQDFKKAVTRYLTACLVIWLLVFALIFGGKLIDDNWTSKPDVAQTRVSELATVVVKVARVRSGPGTAYKVIGGVKQGENVQVLSESNDWSHVRAGSLVGYVYSSLLEFEPIMTNN